MVFVLAVKIHPVEGAGDANPRESGVARVLLGYEAQELGVTTDFVRERAVLDRAVLDREGLSGRKKAMIVLTGSNRRGPLRHLFRQNFLVSGKRPSVPVG